MSLYNQKFEELNKKKEKAFIPFVVLGDPDFNTSKKILDVIAKEADCLELGFPFSDPIADGKRIQAADERALKAKINTNKCFELIKYIRKKNKDIPIGLLLYYNLVYSNGTENFLKKAKSAGVNGILIADMPIEESDSMQKLCEKYGMEQIFIVSPLTKGTRMQNILSKAKGFVYVVSVLGVTGERKQIKSSTINLIKRIKKHSKTPICVGFGISKQDHVKKVIREGADGVIIGSAIEAIIEKNLKNKNKMFKELTHFVKKIKGATKNAKNN